MKKIILYTAIMFVAGLFASGAALSAGTYSGSEGSKVGEQTPSTSVPGVTSSVTHQLNDEQIREMQSILQDEGYYAGEITGELDADTRSALEEFQRSEGLAVTGEPDQDTLRSLAPSAEQQEFFGVSPEFGEEGVIEERGTLEERETLEQQPTGEERLQETPRAVD